MQLQITAEDCFNISALTKGHLTMPEAMLLAKLTLCSHGNGSCWSPMRKEKTKRTDSKCLHQMSKRAKLHPCNHCDYPVLNSAVEAQLRLGALARFIYSVLLPVGVPAGPPRSREPTYHCRVDFRSTSSHTVNSSLLCRNSEGGGADG